jgi:membrane protease YdiL (CAAX protease family)
MTDNKKFAANTTILFVFISFIAMSFVGSFVLDPTEPGAILSEAIFSGATQIVCLGILPLALFSLLRKKGGAGSQKDFETLSEHVGLSAPKGKAMRRVIWITVCAVMISGVISLLTQFALSFLPSGGLMEAVEDASETEVMSLSALGVALILGGVFAAVFEELTFRGILLGAYKDSPKTGVFLSAALFALMHMNIDQTFYAFFMGIVLAVLTLKSRSIIPAMVVHFLNNAWNYITVFLLSQFVALASPAGAEDAVAAEEAVGAAGGVVSEILGIVVAAVIILPILGGLIYGLVSNIKKINEDNPVDWTAKSAETTGGKARLATAATVIVGVVMTGLTVVFRML